MINILMPTDFTIQSLKAIDTLLETFPGETFNISLTHVLKSDTSISAILMLRRRSIENALISESFSDACDILRNKYTSVIDKITVQFFYASTKYYMRSFLDARQIDYIVFSKDYNYEMPSNDSLEPRKEFEKAKTEKLELAWKAKTHSRVGETYTISELIYI